MEPAVLVAVLWAVFAGTHLVLATGNVRRALVDRLGEGGFTQLFTLVAAVSFAMLVAYYVKHRFEGVSGLGLGDVPALNWALRVVLVAGVMLMAGGLAAYPQLPMARAPDTFFPLTIVQQPVRRPYGLARITRHPLFVGIAISSLAHALLARHLVGTGFLLGFAVLAVAGARLQDAKLLASRGRAYADYVAATSIVPFAAILSRRQTLAVRELPWRPFAIGLAVAVALRLIHDKIFAYGGAGVTIVVIGGAFLAGLHTRRRAARSGLLASRT